MKCSRCGCELPITEAEMAVDQEKFKESIGGEGLVVTFLLCGDCAPPSEKEMKAAKLHRFPGARKGENPN